MPVINTEDLRPGPVQFSQQIYNGLDCALTYELLTTIKAHNQTHLTPQAPASTIYGFERALQAPALEMMLRGFKVNQYERQKAIERLKTELKTLDSILQEFSFAVIGKSVNPRSQQQLQHLFYTAMHIPEVWTSKKGVRKLSMDRDALEKIELYFHAKPLVGCILVIREKAKLLEVLETQIDPDGRFRSSYNIAGTETGRWSSSKSVTGTGGNSQNITADLRHILEADPGWKLCAIDLEQAESREVGWLCGLLFNDWSYYDACLAGDLHTITSRLVWPKLPWTGDLKSDRALAEQPFYRHFSYRDMAKRGGHGSNYYGTPYTMAKHLKVRSKVMEDFQKAYFGAYPGIPKWHRWTAEQLQTVGHLETIFGRVRHFFGRANDDTTLREAIAFSPQSATADRMNLILWRLWHYMGSRIQLLAQVHDAVYFQFREDDNEADVVSTALSYFPIPIRHSGRTLTVPGEAKTGWNWGNQVTKKNPLTGAVSVENPYGLAKFKGSDTRRRPTGLDIIL